MISFKMLEAFVKDMVWHDKVSDLLGTEWDSIGNNVYEIIWDNIYEVWGDAGADLISDYISWVATEGETETPYVTDLESDEDFFAESDEGLWELLNKYFLKEEV